MKQCLACLNDSMEFKECQYCGTEEAAIELLVRADLNPSSVYDELLGRPGFYRLTTTVAKLAISILTNKQEEMN